MQSFVDGDKGLSIKFASAPLGSSYENPYPPREVPKAVEQDRPKYVGDQPHRFNTRYGMDDLAVQIDRALQKVEAENAELRETIEFMKKRLDYFL